MIDADEPACWSWPVTPEDLDDARNCPPPAGHILLWNWQRENQMVVEVMRRYRLVNPATRLALRLRHTATVRPGQPLPRRYEAAVPIGRPCHGTPLA